MNIYNTLCNKGRSFLFVFSLLFISFSFNSTIKAQTVLGPGDIAITGYHSDSPEMMQMVLLTDVLANTQFIVTDNGWFADGFRDNEGEITVTLTDDQPCGTLLQLVNIDDVTVSVALEDESGASLGTAVETNLGFNLNGNGDQAIIYQTPTNFITAVNFSPDGWLGASTMMGDGLATASTSTLPTGLTDGLNAFAFPTSTSPDNGTYDCSTLMGTQTELNMAINNSVNWSTNSTMQAFNNCAFVCVAEPDPSEVPTLSQWGLITLSLLMMIFGVTYSRKKDLKPAYSTIKK